MQYSEGGKGRIIRAKCTETGANATTPTIAHSYARSNNNGEKRELLYETVRPPLVLLQYYRVYDSGEVPLAFICSMLSPSLPTPCVSVASQSWHGGFSKPLAPFLARRLAACPPATEKCYLQ